MAHTHSLSHRSDEDIIRGLHALVEQERAVTAKRLAGLGEIEARRLYLPDHPSILEYCVYGLGIDEDETVEYIHAARAARKFPALVHAVADGRLHLASVILLARHLTDENADHLISAAAGRTVSEIVVFLAELFPIPGLDPKEESGTPPPPSDPRHAADVGGSGR